MHESTSLTTQGLGNGYRLLSGLLPKELTWEARTFETAWQLHPVPRDITMILDRPVESPRFQQACGRDYHDTDQTNWALPMPEILAPLLAWVKATIDQRLNGILLHWFDGPGHYIVPHHDSTKNMVKGAPIVTVSFGETRTFRLTREEKPDRTWSPVETKDFPALHGTVFVMPYETNEVWKHGVPTAARYRGRRISVTFRAFERK